MATLDRETISRFMLHSATDSLDDLEEVEHNYILSLHPLSKGGLEGKFKELAEYVVSYVEPLVITNYLGLFESDLAIELGSKYIEEEWFNLSPEEIKEQIRVNVSQEFGEISRMM